MVVEPDDEYHARYGVLIYWHVDRKSVCVYSQLRSCNASEVAAMMEGVLRHCTDATIDRQYTDTHGQSVVGFAFAHLLGFRLLPRMKNISHQKLVKADAGDTVPSTSQPKPQPPGAATPPATTNSDRQPSPSHEYVTEDYATSPVLDPYYALREAREIFFGTH